MSNLIEAAITAAEIQEGRTRKTGGIPLALVSANRKRPKSRRQTYTRWTHAEDQFLRNNLGNMTEGEIAAHLGRTRVSVMLRWKRDLHLVAPSKDPRFLTGHQASIHTGIEQHKITHWCDAGLICHYLMAGDRKIRLIPRISLDRWITSPSNWIYFDWRELKDARLRGLCQRRADRWGDEWWTSRQVADYHGVSTKDVQRLIYRAELPARQVATSRGGRHKDPAWLNWFVLKSDALKATFIKGYGSGTAWKPTERQQTWMRKARFELGMSCVSISRTMGGTPNHQTISNWCKKDLTNSILNS